MHETLTASIEREFRRNWPARFLTDEIRNNIRQAVDRLLPSLNVEARKFVTANIGFHNKLSYLADYILQRRTDQRSIDEAIYMEVWETLHNGATQKLVFPSGKTGKFLENFRFRSHHA